jgi:hypothetical protein
MYSRLALNSQSSCLSLLSLELQACATTLDPIKLFSVPHLHFNLMIFLAWPMGCWGGTCATPQLNWILTSFLTNAIHKTAVFSTHSSLVRES